MPQLTQNTIAENIAQAEGLIITEEFARALQLIESGANVFIHGKPGTGKSCFISFLRERLYNHGIAVLAPTGLAALNSKGQTIHSFLSLSIYKIYRTKNLRKQEKVALRKRLENITTLVVDEVSMVRADLFDEMDKKLRDILEVNRPFAGLQLVLIGDMYQLPPVVKPTKFFDDTAEKDTLFMDTYGENKSFIFHSKAYKELDLKHIEFTHNFRQDDADFIKHLDIIRSNKDEILPEALGYFNACAAVLPTNITWLTATNAAADAINMQKLRALNGREYLVNAIIQASPVQKRPDNWQDCPQNPLKLKEGAFVMFVKNDEGKERRWVNGTTGIIKEISAGQDGQVQHIIVQTDNGEYMVERHTWYKLRLTTDGEQVEDPERTYSQFPLRLAWAVTIHKAQGLTLEKAVIDLGAEAFAQGQVYVALSRLRSKKGLYLARPINKSDIKVSAQVSDFLTAALKK